jgi:hypothetical protein
MLASAQTPLGKLGSNARAPITLSMLGVNGSDLRQQPLVGELALTRRALAPGIVSAARDTDGIAKHAHWELSLLRVHHLVGAHERSLTKKATDFLAPRALPELRVFAPEPFQLVLHRLATALASLLLSGTPVFLPPHVQQILGYAKARGHVGDSPFAAPLEQPDRFTLELFRMLLSLPTRFGSMNAPRGYPPLGVSGKSGKAQGRAC